MTDKRFRYEGAKIFDGEELLCCTLSIWAEQLVDLLNELHEENEQLKKENMEYYQLVNCGNCKYHNYDWFDDGDEFEVCDKGHTERLMYNQFCEEWEEL